VMVYSSRCFYRRQQKPMTSELRQQRSFGYSVLYDSSLFDLLGDQMILIVSKRDAKYTGRMPIIFIHYLTVCFFFQPEQLKKNILPRLLFICGIQLSKSGFECPNGKEGLLMLSECRIIAFNYLPLKDK
jgi:hypothetical protein